ncbi:MAG: hypothetical protein IKV58_01645 [Oscillospiraceae bacterium]|nr:hypothetical protein [Oscillospiraceae bacterium]
MKKIDFKNLFESKRFVKVFSVLLAILAWLIVVLTIDTETTATIKQVPVQINLEDTVAQSLGLEPIEGAEQYVNVLVRGKRYVVGALKPDDITATVSLGNVIEPGKYTFSVHTSETVESLDYSIVTTTPKTIGVAFDRMKTKKMPIEVETNDISVRDEYILEKAYASTTSVSLHGPEADIDLIDRVVATTDVSGVLEKTVIQPAQIKYFDAENKELSLPKVTTTPDNIEITIPVFKQKTLPLQIQFTNVPTSFPIEAIRYTLSETEILVAAPIDATDISALDVGFIDFREFDINKDYSFNVTLPNGYLNLSNLKTVDVKFNFIGYSSKNVTVNSSLIKNTPSGYTVTAQNNPLDVKLYGPSASLNSLRNEDIVVEVDLANTNIKAGSQKVPAKVYVTGEKAIWAVGQYDVMITATEKNK